MPPASPGTPCADDPRRAPLELSTQLRPGPITGSLARRRRHARYEAPHGSRRRRVRSQRVGSSAIGSRRQIPACAQRRVGVGCCVDAKPPAVIDPRRGSASEAGRPERPVGGVWSYLADGRHPRGWGAGRALLPGSDLSARMMIANGSGPRLCGRGCGRGLWGPRDDFRLWERVHRLTCRPPTVANPPTRCRV